VISCNFVRYFSKVLLVKHAKPNQPTYFVRYNRVFVVTVIFITEFDSIYHFLLATMDLRTLLLLLATMDLRILLLLLATMDLKVLY
jgi:hypothetical protein